MERSLTSFDPRVQCLSEQLQVLALQTKQIMTWLDSFHESSSFTRVPAKVGSPFKAKRTAPSNGAMALLRCVDEEQPMTFANTVDFFIMNLKARAHEWASAEWESHYAICDLVASTWLPPGHSVGLRFLVCLF